MFSLLIPSITAALVTTGSLILYYHKRKIARRKAFLMAYLTELVELFNRTVMYYNQRLEHQISYSALYEATASDMLTQFTEVVDDPRVINAIIRLKERYFQIQRHAMEAARLATEFSIQNEKYRRLINELGPNDDRVKKAHDDSQDAIERAKHAQGRALGFFPFDDMIKWTSKIIDYAKREINTPVVYSLEKEFYEGIKKKYEADSEYQKSTSKQG